VTRIEGSTLDGRVGIVLASLLSPSATAVNPLLGIWSSATRFGPTLQGELTVAAEGPSWRATLSGAEARFRATRNHVRFSFPRSLGQFRGVLTDDGSAIEGFWLRPSGETAARRSPSGSGQPFATPIVLGSAGPKVWRGTLRPLEDRFTLYLKIFHDAEGALVGAFRNPDLNSIGGASHFRLTREGDSVRFSARRDPADPEIRLDAALLRRPDRLQVFWPNIGSTLDLTRRAPSDAPAFWPRPPGDPTYQYREPPSTGDGWETACPADVGMDEVPLTRLVQRLIDADPAARRPALIHSLLLAHRGKLVLDEYFFGFDGETPHDLRSAGKTFAAVMLGAAMRHGAKLAPETPVYDLLAAMGPFANPDPRKSLINLAHLMTHTSGLAADDNDEASPGNERTMSTQRRQPDWWKYTLDLPMAHHPGSRYAYSSAGMNLMGAALTTGTGTWLPELFDHTVARPLEFGPYHWNLMPTGEGYLGGGAWLRPRDLLKVGQVYLDDGVWKGRRIVDASWVTSSTAQHVEISGASTGLDAEQFPNFYNKGADGYSWHLNQLRSGDRVYREYEASGNGGQLLIVIPELDLVVVFTAGNYLQGGIWGRFRDEIVPREIIPAITG